MAVDDGVDFSFVDRRLGVASNLDCVVSGILVVAVDRLIVAGVAEVVLLALLAALAEVLLLLGVRGGGRAAGGRVAERFAGLDFGSGFSIWLLDLTVRGLILGMAVYDS
jgi:hypothetical protein